VSPQTTFVNRGTGAAIVRISKSCVWGHIQRDLTTTMKKLYILLIFAGIAFASNAQQTRTFAERLGFPKGAKVLILHVDDAGM
jgi:hypothetical protein